MKTPARCLLFCIFILNSITNEIIPISKNFSSSIQFFIELLFIKTQHQICEVRTFDPCMLRTLTRLQHSLTSVGRITIPASQNHLIKKKNHRAKARRRAFGSHFLLGMGKQFSLPGEARKALLASPLPRGNRQLLRKTEGKST